MQETLNVSTSKHNVTWQVSLSNGETFFEYKGPFVEVEGELSPWQKLLLYIAERNCSITSLSLLTPNGQKFNLPSAGKNPKFRAFDLADKPIDYKMHRSIGIEPQGQTDLYTVATAVYPTYQLQIWVDEYNPTNSWSLVLPKI